MSLLETCQMFKLVELAATWGQSGMGTSKLTHSVPSLSAVAEMRKKVFFVIALATKLIMLSS